MRQTWLDLLFAHWRVPPDVMRGRVPPEVPVDTFDGSAWLGVTPFEVAGLRPRGGPPMRRFRELNVRTYTSIGGRPGIWFFTLEASSLAAVLGARLTYRLPYHRARMSIERAGDRIRYRSERPGVVFRAEYGPTGPPAPAAAGTLEHFLTARYSLFTLDRRRRLRRADIAHPPWPLQPATAQIDGAPAPLAHFAARQDVLVWPLKHAEDQ
jgi:uncharacterized protein YqjF (DUF2071 family)